LRWDEASLAGLHAVRSRAVAGVRISLGAHSLLLGGFWRFHRRGTLTRRSRATLRKFTKFCVNLLVILALFHIRVHYFVFGGTTHPKTHAAACASRCEITLVSHTETEKRDAAARPRQSRASSSLRRISFACGTARTNDRSVHAGSRCAAVAPNAARSAARVGCRRSLAHVLAGICATNGRSACARRTEHARHHHILSAKGPNDPTALEPAMA
jgi:hypothetical protein